MAKLDTIKVEVERGPLLVAFLEHNSALIVERDEYKYLYESSKNTMTVLLEELTQAKHELDSLKGVASV